MDGNSPLHLAAAHGDLEASLHLLGEGADFSLENVEGKTAVDVAKESIQRDLSKWASSGTFAFLV